MIADQYIEQGAPVTFVLQMVGLSKSMYYYQCSNRKKGAKPSLYTMKQNGDFSTNEKVVEDIKAILNEEFVDYGYIKITYWLREEMHYIINFKKVYRLMKE